MNQLLIVCAGNICRSPMAEAWFRGQLDGGTKVGSAGVSALVGHPADSLAIDVALRHGFDISSHRARQVNIDLINSADLILTMDKPQREYIVKLAPWSTGKVWRIGETSGQDIDDPYRHGSEKFEIAFNTIIRLSQTWLNFVKAQ